MNNPMLIDSDTLERALELYRVWADDQQQLGLTGQLSLWVEDQGAGLRWRLRVEHELACRAFDLSGF
jgi:hypothetical protein